MPYVQYDFLTLSADQEQRLTRQIQEHRDEALLARADFPIRHAERYRRFLCDPTLRPPGPWPESARLSLPTVRVVLERLQDETWQALFANMLQVRAVPFGDEDVPGADLASAFLRWTLEQTMPWQQIAADLIFDALLDSVGVAKVSAWVPPWPQPSRDPRRFLRRLSRIDALDVGMLLVAPDAEGLQYPECRFVHQEFFLAEDDLFRMEKVGFDVPAYDQLGDSQRPTERKRIEMEREGERVIEFHPESIPFVESYERFTLEEDTGDEDVIVSWFPDAQVHGTSHNTASNHGRIAGVRRLIDVFPQDDRPRRPFFPMTFWGQPRQWRGLNVPDRLESMKDMIDRLHEQLINYGEVSMLPFVFVNTFLTGEIPDLRTVRPGATVPIDDISGVQFAPTRSLNRHFAEQIAMMQAAVERDSRVTDFNLGRQGQASNAPRTASATMALLAEARKTYGSLIRRSALQFSALLSFHFRLWQEILPDDTYAQIAPYNQLYPVPNTPYIEPQRDVPGEQQSSTLWDRLFAPRPATDTGRPLPEMRMALPISREQLSGFYDVRIDVNPEEQFDRQVLLSLLQVTAPAVQDYPVGMRMMLKQLWTAFDQRGFEAIYPEELALLQTQQRMMAIQVQLATFEGQLRQLDQAEAQQQMQQVQGALAQGSGGSMPGREQQGSAISPQFALALQAALAGQGQGDQATSAPTNGTTIPLG